MTDLLIYNTRMITPQKILERGWVICRDGRISAIGNGDPVRKPDKTAINAQGLTLLPGFIDIHTHGAIGHDVMSANPDSLIAMSQFFVRHGVTGFLASTWTAPQDAISKALGQIKNTIKNPNLGAHLLGAHLEGPYLNPKYAGAQATAFIRHADMTEARDWLALGVIKLISLAPEIVQNHWLIREAVAQGITISVGYSDATYDEMQSAILLGLSHSTHTFNSMRPFHHRDGGVVGAVMESNQITSEIIPDGVHVSDGAMRLLWMLKKPDKLVLVTDSLHPTGLGDGHFMIDDRPLTVTNGIAQFDDNRLAGGTITLDEGLRRFMRAVNEPIESVWQTVSLNPARAVHVAHRKGSIEIGKDADLVLMDEQLCVQKTLVMGRVVYEA